MRCVCRGLSSSRLLLSWHGHKIDHSRDLFIKTDAVGNQKSPDSIFCTAIVVQLFFQVHGDMFVEMWFPFEGSQALLILHSIACQKPCPLTKDIPISEKAAFGLAADFLAIAHLAVDLAAGFGPLPWFSLKGVSPSSSDLCSPWSSFSHHLRLGIFGDFDFFKFEGLDPTYTNWRIMQMNGNPLAQLQGQITWQVLVSQCCWWMSWSVS